MQAARDFSILVQGKVGQADNFIWGSEYVKQRAEILVCDLQSNTKVKNTECVITDLDFYLSRGLTVEKLNKCGLITEFEILEQRLKKNDSEQNHDIDLESMMLRIISRWRYKLLNNKALEDLLEQRIIYNIIELYLSRDGLEGCPLIKKSIDLAVKSVVTCKVAECLCQNNQAFIDMVANTLFKDLKEGHINDDDILSMLEIGGRSFFLEWLKSVPQSPELVSLDEKLVIKWIIDIKDNNTAGVSSLNSYCLELAIKLNGGACQLDMSPFLKDAFRDILRQWRNNALPQDRCQLLEHLEKYLRSYFCEETLGTLYEPIIKRVIKTLVVKKQNIVKEYVYNILHKQITVDLANRLVSADNNCHLAVHNALMDIINNRRDATTGIACELSGLLGVIFNVKLYDNRLPIVNWNLLFLSPVTRQSVTHRDSDPSIVKDAKFI